MTLSFFTWFDKLGKVTCTHSLKKASIMDFSYKVGAGFNYAFENK